MQKYILADKNYDAFKRYLGTLNCKRALLVHGKSMVNLTVGQVLLRLPDSLGIDVVEFTDFTSNPDIESAIKGSKLCCAADCDLIIACGGGSAIDVAKCIRLFRELDTGNDNFFENLLPGKIPFVVIPTTAGTGSEATHFAVIYKNGQKLSLGEKGNIPQAVLWDTEVFCSLPLKQKRSTYFDAFCHAVESYWSVKATEESKIYAAEALRLLLTAGEDYLGGNSCERSNMLMLLAANYAGRAINISKTTAAHAMCYKLTGMFGLPHGQAAALCLDVLWRYMISISQNKNMVSLNSIWTEIADIMGENNVSLCVDRFHKMLCKYDQIPAWQITDRANVIDTLAKSVNTERLQNHPLKLEQSDFRNLYGQLFNEVGEGWNDED